jgi:hypothetical protein
MIVIGGDGAKKQDPTEHSSAGFLFVVPAARMHTAMAPRFPMCSCNGDTAALTNGKWEDMSVSGKELSCSAGKDLLW